MKRQDFLVSIRIKASVEQGINIPYLTEARVRKQMEKFLADHHITDGLPCHGEATMRVTEVQEVEPREESVS